MALECVHHFENPWWRLHWSVCMHEFTHIRWYAPARFDDTNNGFSFSCELAPELKNWIVKSIKSHFYCNPIHAFFSIQAINDVKMWLCREPFLKCNQFSNEALTMFHNSHTQFQNCLLYAIRLSRNNMQNHANFPFEILHTQNTSQFNSTDAPIHHNLMSVRIRFYLISEFTFKNFFFISMNFYIDLLPLLSLAS